MEPLPGECFCYRPLAEFQRAFVVKTKQSGRQKSLHSRDPGEKLPPQLEEDLLKNSSISELPELETMANLGRSYCFDRGGHDGTFRLWKYMICCTYRSSANGYGKNDGFQIVVIVWAARAPVTLAMSRQAPASCTNKDLLPFHSFEEKNRFPIFVHDNDRKCEFFTLRAEIGEGSDPGGCGYGRFSCGSESFPGGDLLREPPGRSPPARGGGRVPRTITVVGEDHFVEDCED